MDLESSKDVGDRSASHILADAALRQSVAFDESVTAPESQEDLSPDHDDLGRRILANVYCDPVRHTVTFLLDEVTANYAMYAARVLAADSEAHAREVRLAGAVMPVDSYGAANRHEIALRNERIARRVRVLERQYHDVVEAPVENLKESTRRGPTTPRRSDRGGLIGLDTRAENREGVDAHSSLQ
jgi:hypothetical protein